MPAQSFQDWFLFWYEIKWKNKKVLLNPSMTILVHLYSGEFGCNMVLCNEQGLGQNAAQKAVLHWSYVSCIAHSCASLCLSKLLAF